MERWVSKNETYTQVQLNLKRCSQIIPNLRHSMLFG